MEKIVGVAQLYFMPHPLLEIVQRLMAHPVFGLRNLQDIKSSHNKKDLNDVTAALFLVSFSQLPVAKKHQKRGSCEAIKVPLISEQL